MGVAAHCHVGGLLIFFFTHARKSVNYTQDFRSRDGIIWAEKRLGLSNGLKESQPQVIIDLGPWQSQPTLDFEDEQNKNHGLQNESLWGPGDEVRGCLIRTLGTVP